MDKCHWSALTILEHRIFKIIAASCSEFISLSEPTLSRRRLDVASLLISTSQVPIPLVLNFKVNGEYVTLHIVENDIDVEMAKDDVEDDSSQSSKRSEEEAAAISENDPSIEEVNPKNSANLADPDFDESTTKDSQCLEELSAPNSQKSNTAFSFEGKNKNKSGPKNNGPSLISSKKLTHQSQRKKKRISLSGSLKTDYTDTLSESDIMKRNLAIIESLNNSTL